MQVRENQKNILEDFFSNQEVLRSSVHLFACNKKLEIESEQRGKKSIRTYLRRSDQMINLVSNELGKVIEDFKAKSNRYEGVIYMMFKKDKSQGIIPLYIGKAEKYGKSDNLSENISKGKGKFGRWGHGYAYHIGDLSAVVYDHKDANQPKKYKDWAKSMFESYPASSGSKLVLKEPIYLWMKAWERDSIGLWKDFGSTTLTFLEYQLIGVSTAVYPDSVLNKEGQNR